jgi:hypothetical protein
LGSGTFMKYSDPPAPVGSLTWNSSALRWLTWYPSASAQNSAWRRGLWQSTTTASSDADI